MLRKCVRNPKRDFTRPPRSGLAFCQVHTSIRKSRLQQTDYLSFSAAKSRPRPRELAPRRLELASPRNSHHGTLQNSLPAWPNHKASRPFGQNSHVRPRCGTSRRFPAARSGNWPRTGNEAPIMKLQLVGGTPLFSACSCFLIGDSQSSVMVGALDSIPDC